MQCKRPRFDPWLGKILWIREWQPTPVFFPGESHGQRSLAGYSPWDSKESDTTEQLTVLLFLNKKFKVSVTGVATSHLVNTTNRIPSCLCLALPSLAHCFCAGQFIVISYCIPSVISMCQAEREERSKTQIKAEDKRAQNNHRSLVFTVVQVGFKTVYNNYFLSSSLFVLILAEVDSHWHSSFGVNGQKSDSS